MYQIGLCWYSPTRPTILGANPLGSALVVQMTMPRLWHALIVASMAGADALTTRGIALTGITSTSRRAPTLHHASSRRRAFVVLSAKKRFILFQIIDDVLDYLTNMGGYTGFTEEELKGGVGSTGVDLNQNIQNVSVEYF